MHFLYFHFVCVLCSPAAVAAGNHHAPYPSSDLVATENPACEPLSCHKGSWTLKICSQCHRTPATGHCLRQLGRATALGVTCSRPPPKWESWRTGSDYQQG